ncbi:MAG: hypothetical protein HYX79_03735 [Chloroflexi bacterium]|nr:hypothetical protein [Chloroflexota bacterium]
MACLSLPAVALCVGGSEAEGYLIRGSMPCPPLAGGIALLFIVEGKT